MTSAWPSWPGAHFLEGITGMYADIIAQMMDAGTMKKDDPQLLAMEYVAPAAVLIQLGDREPARADECMGRIEAHITRFCAAWGN